MNMIKLSCNIGDKFGEWTVLETNCGSKNGHTYVKCQCSCGVIKEINLTALVRGRTTRCRHCAARSRTHLIKLGSHIKNWTVLDGPIYKGTYSYYKVRCDCGKEQLKLTHEILAKDSNFRCPKCAQKENKRQFMVDNGKVGDLNLTIYTHFKNSALKRNLEFNVSIEYLWKLFLAQNKECAITGDKIVDFKRASLDRIDSSKGYIEGNVQWTTRQANISKHIMTMDELYEFCRKVLNHANQQPSMGLTTHEGSETNS